MVSKIIFRGKKMKKKYIHNGKEFYRNPEGEIRGLWITDVPLEEQAYIDACKIVGYKYSGDNAPSNFVGWGDSWLSWTENSFYSHYSQEGHKITWQEFIQIFGKDEHRERWLKTPVKVVNNDELSTEFEKELTYGETQSAMSGDTTKIKTIHVKAQGHKEPFPALQPNGYLKPKDAVRFMIDGGECVDTNGYAVRFGSSFFLNQKEGRMWTFDFLKPKLKETDSHADIKARYAEAKAEEANGGLIVKYKATCKENGEVYFVDEMRGDWTNKYYDWGLAFYEIHWPSVLAWSYANGEFIECEAWTGDSTKAIYETLIGINASNGWFKFDGIANGYKHCRIISTEPKPEWLREIKQ
jgi:hypothetical protein